MIKRRLDSMNFNGKKALVRVDYNVPLDENLQVRDDLRIRASVPTIQKIRNDGGSVILMSHLGRPGLIPEKKFSLANIIERTSSLLGCEVQFADDCIGEASETKAANLKAREVLLLENLRFHAGEKKGEEDFAARLASLGDVYVNDAFGTAHRAHASTAVIAKFFPDKKVFGYLIERELKAIDKVMNEPERPFTAILGGAKVSGKLEVIEQMLNKVDKLIIGGGMAYTFIKAGGGNIGDSLCQNELLQTASDILAKAKEKHIELLLPEDTLIADRISEDANTQVNGIMNIPEKWMGADIGPASIDTFSQAIASSKTILWNGPMGIFEMPVFANGTKAIATAIEKATANGAYSMIGGGDSVAAVRKFGFEDKMSYISTGGGALIEYIEGKELPGIAAINH